jgi:hypothetical protein
MMASEGRMMITGPFARLPDLDHRIPEDAA